MLSDPYEKDPLLINFFKKIYQNLYGAICFSVENAKPRYPYTLVGEKRKHSSNKTLLCYRISGKHEILEMEASELCNSKNLISRFHPLDVRTISFIAGIEQIIDIPVTDRRLALRRLKDDILR